MEIQVLEHEGLPLESIVMIRAGQMRRQAKLDVGLPFQFPALPLNSNSLRFEVFQPLSSKSLTLSVDAETYKVRVPATHELPPSTLELRIQDKHIAQDIKAIEDSRGNDNNDSNDNNDENKKNDNNCNDDVDGDVHAPTKVNVASKARHYLQKHDVVHFVQDMLTIVLKEKPDDPYSFMSAHARTRAGSAAQKSPLNEDGQTKALPSHEPTKEESAALVPRPPTEERRQDQPRRPIAVPPAPVIPQESAEDALRRKAREALVLCASDGRLAACLKDSEQDADALRCRARRGIVEGMKENMQAHPSQPSLSAAVKRELSREVSSRLREDTKSLLMSVIDQDADARGPCASHRDINCFVKPSVAAWKLSPRRRQASDVCSTPDPTSCPLNPSADFYKQRQTVQLDAALNRDNNRLVQDNDKLRAEIERLQKLLGEDLLGTVEKLPVIQEPHIVPIRRQEEQQRQVSENTSLWSEREEMKQTLRTTLAGLEHVAAEIRNAVESTS